MNQLTLERLAIKPEDRVLEIGFGGGDLLNQILSSTQSEFVGYHSVGIEPYLLKLRRRRM